MSCRISKKSKINNAFKAACLMTAVLLCLAALPIFAGSDSLLTSKPSGGENAAFSYMPHISAESAILIEASTGEVIAAKDPDRRMPMASTTKIMTALVAIESGETSRTVSVSPLAVGIEGSSIYLYEGEQLTMLDLLYAMLLESANDAAAAIAIEIGGSIDGFAELMNDKAAELGLENTHFTNPHGLDDPEHYTTARELSIIAAAAMKNETFRAIVSTYKITIPLNQTEGVRLLINHNKMLKGYEGAIGIKTGYTKKSGRCLVSAAMRDGVELIAVTLNAPNDWQDHTTMLDHGFSLYESRLLCQAGEFERIQPVIGGAEDYVLLTNTDEASITLPKSASQVTCTVEIDRFTFAPVRQGEVVGQLVYSLDGKVVAQVPIYAAYSVERTVFKKNLWEKLCSLFGK